MVAVLLGLLAAGSAWGWNGNGHRFVAAIAWQQLSPTVRQKVGNALARHPDYPDWLARSKESDPAYAAFLAAATWPDSLRRDPRFHDDHAEPESPAAPAPGAPPFDYARHSHWHYMDLLADGSRQGKGEIAERLELLIASLRDPAQRPYALPWLIHLVGDIHQPLHVGSRGDEGGNGFAIEDSTQPRAPFSNLHSWWDNLPGNASLNPTRLAARVEALLALYPPPPQGTVSQWRDESWQLAHQRAYPDAAGSLLPLITADFARQSQDIALRRLVAAGYRLGRLLEQQLGRSVKLR
ncbi:MAG: hypothetical protein RIR00_2074 [Pseudomonadota bacterium]|jgi:hypothetical protein